MAAEVPVPASFRDPAGGVFRRGDRFFRRVLPPGFGDLRRLVDSGLAGELCGQGRLTGFRIVAESPEERILELETLPFVSYPYEWCFSQLRDAALLTLDVALAALEHGMILKDASSFNVAFVRCRPVFIDHGSFTCYRDGEPWRAYRQFVMHFLGPLFLMKYVDVRCLGYLRGDLGGIPLDFISAQLPGRTWLSPGPLLHVHLHSKMQRRYSDTRGGDVPAPGAVALPRRRLERLLLDLRGCVEGLASPHPVTEWGEYYDDTNYSERAFRFKQEMVERFCRETKPARTVDFGANTGVFSGIALRHSGDVIAADLDPAAVEMLYRRNAGNAIHPVLQDLDNPSPGSGLFNEERSDFFSRSRGDLVLGLALVHHLRIGGNWPLERIARLFAETAPRALVEFVPKHDSQTRRLLRSRPDICADWTLDELVRALGRRYHRCEVLPIPESERTLIELSGLIRFPS